MAAILLAVSDKHFNRHTKFSSLFLGALCAKNENGLRERQRGYTHVGRQRKNNINCLSYRRHVVEQLKDQKQARYVCRVNSVYVCARRHVS